MTCVAGLVHEGKVYIAADSQGSSALRHSSRKDEKVFQIEDILFGFASSYRGGQVVHYWFGKPKHDKNTSVDEYMHRFLVPAVRKVMADNGTLWKKEDIESSLAQFLIGYRGRLFTIDTDFQVGETHCGYDAIGSGASVAIGALYATRNSTEDPPTRLIAALEAAETHSRGVGGPFVYGEV